MLLIGCVELWDISNTRPGAETVFNKWVKLTDTTLRFAPAAYLGRYVIDRDYWNVPKKRRKTVP